MIRQEQIEETLGFGLLAQIGDNGGRCPPGLLQLGLVDALCWNAFGLNPIVNLLDLLNGNRSELGFDPWGDTCERRVALNLYVGCHVAELLRVLLGRRVPNVISTPSTRVRNILRVHGSAIPNGAHRREWNEAEGIAGN